MSNRRRATRRTASGVALAIVLIIIAGCSTSGGGSKTPATSTSTGTPTNGGTLEVAQSTDASPQSFLSPAIGNILTQYSVFETLTLENPTTGQPQPVLATSWKFSSNGLHMSIQLRHGVTFHNGAPFTSADVIYTLKKMQNPADSAQGAQLAGSISGMTAKGKYEVDLAFKRPMPNIFDLFEIMPIVDPSTYNEIASGKVVNGTGPFVWKSWKPGAQIVLQKYNNFWDAKTIHLNTIKIDVITDPTALRAAVQSGRDQYAIGLAGTDATSLAAQPGYALYQSGGSNMELCFNVTQAPFNNLAVRQAMQYAVDRQRIVDQVENKIGTATDLPWNTSVPGLDASMATQYTYQPQKAKQMLTAAGVKSGTSFNLVSLNTPEVSGIVQILESNFSAVGLKMKPQLLSDSDFNLRTTKGNMGAPAFVLQVGTAFQPITQVQVRPELMATGNTEDFKSSEYTSLVNALTTAVSSSAQSTALHNYATYYLKQAFCMPMLRRPTLSVRSTSVNGIAATSYGFINLSNAYISN